MAAFLAGQALPLHSKGIIEGKTGIRRKCGRKKNPANEICMISTRAKTIRLRQLLQEKRIHLMPCCGDGLSAKLIQRANFDFTFMSGFATAGSKGLPDTGLLGYKEMLENVAETSDVIDIPIIADADTGFGNAVNVRRTVMGFAKAGASGLLIEDQVNPKR